MTCRGLPADPAALLLARRPAHAEETQVDVLRRHRAMHLKHGGEIICRGRPDLDRAAVGEQRIDTATGFAHAILPGSAAPRACLMCISLVVRAVV
jgi:hypothetical protein